MNLLRGFLSKTWLSVASTYFQNACVKVQTRNDGHHRLTKAVRALYNLTSKLWKGRNEKLHANENATSLDIRTTIDAEIAEYQRNPANLSVHDQHYCDMPIQVLLRKPPSYKRRWLHRVREASARFQLESGQQHRITSFFKTQTDHRRQKAHQPTQFHKLLPPSNQPTALTRRQIITTQLLLTKFFRERAPNSRLHSHQESPPLPPPL